MAIFAPSWAETSVRWLRSNAPTSLAMARAGQRFTDQLFHALEKLRFRQLAPACRTLSLREWTDHLEGLVATWGQLQHEEMVRFINDGGHAGAKARYDAERAKEASMEKVKVPIVDEAGKVVAVEEIALEMDELEQEVEATPGARKPQLSPESELDEIVAEAALGADPRFGAW